MKMFEGGIILMLMGMWNYGYVLIGRTADLDYFMGAIIGGFIIVVMGFLLNYLENTKTEPKENHK